MPWWQLLLDVVGGLLLVVALGLAGLIVRRRLLTRSEPTVEMSVRLRAGDGARGWSVGVARYRDHRLEWFRVFSLSPRPRMVFDRRDLEVHARRDPEGAEAYALFTGHVVVSTVAAGRDVPVALSPQSLTGLLAWLEAAPPGHRRH